jgi:hypothetical protein
MNSALNCLHKWATENNMEINASKTASSNKTVAKHQIHVGK